MRDWDDHYRQHGAAETEPSRVVVRAAKMLPPGRALDLACGSGRNAIYLARHGWDVTAVDGSPVAIDQLRAVEPAVHCIIGDLERHQFSIEPASWDLICDIFYVQPNLFPSIRAGLRAGGIFAAALHINHPRFPLRICQLLDALDGMEILHFTEISASPEHPRDSVELIARNK